MPKNLYSDMDNNRGIQGIPLEEWFAVKTAIQSSPTVAVSQWKGWESGGGSVRKARCLSSSSLVL